MPCSPVNSCGKLCLEILHSTSAGLNIRLLYKNPQAFRLIRSNIIDADETAPFPAPAADALRNKKTYSFESTACNNMEKLRFSEKED
jgi:hypothetical protein